MTAKPNRRQFLGLAGAATTVGLVAAQHPNEAAAHTVRVQTYPLPAIYPTSEDFSLSVNGQPVPVTAFAPEPGSDVEYHYAHFSFRGRITVTVTTSEPIRTHSISPLALEIPSRVVDNQLTFSLNTSRYLIVKINDYKELVIAADPAESGAPAAHGPGIFNVAADFGADSTGEDLSTTAVQAAIDAAHTAGRGTVYVPPGVFTIGNIVLRSRVHLYLAGGSVLRATGDPADYTTHFHKRGLQSDGTWLISTEPGSRDITISGRGTIDGQGARMRKENSYLNHLLIPLDTDGFTLDGVIGRDAGFWAFLPTRCSNVRITNYKGFQSQMHESQKENDAMDINECQDVIVRHVIAISEDDPYSTKAWAADTDIAGNWPLPPRPVENVLFDDVIAWTHTAAFKIGGGHLSPHHDITYRNSYVYDATRAIMVDAIYGTGACTDIVYEDLDIESLSQQHHTNTWLDIHTDRRDDGIGPVSGVRINRINVRDQGRISPRIAADDADGAITDVVLRNVVIEGTPLRTFDQLGITLGPHIEIPSVVYRGH